MIPFLTWRRTLIRESSENGVTENFRAVTENLTKIASKKGRILEKNSPKKGGKFRKRFERSTILPAQVIKKSRKTPKNCKGFLEPFFDLLFKREKNLIK